MKTTAKKQRHLALMRLRALCGLTAERFSRLTGIGYAQLVAVEQGRRELSEADALQVSAATGVDPSFNAYKSSSQIKSLWGFPYSEKSLDQWTGADVPALRAQLARLREHAGGDVFEQVATSNAAEILKAAAVQGRELAVAQALCLALNEVCERFDLGPNIAEWKRFEIKFNDPRPATDLEKKRIPGAATHQRVSCSIITTTGQGLGRRARAVAGIKPQRQPRRGRTGSKSAAS